MLGRHRMEQSFRDWINHKLDNKWHWRQKDTISFFDIGVLRAGSFVTAKAGQAGVRSTGTLPRHGVKRVNRMLKNPRFTKNKMHEASITNFIRLIKNYKMAMLVMDWTEIKGIHLLCISFVTDTGRTVPIVWDGYREGQMPACQSQNKIEESLISKVLNEIPYTTKVIVLADRGFDRAKFAEFLGNYGPNIFYVIRASSDAYIHWRGKRLLLSENLVAKGEWKNYGWVKYSDEHQVRVRFCATWDADMKSPWLLITNISDVSVQTIVSYYGKRMTIEEMFKSMKNEVVGLSLKCVRIKDIDRWLVLCFVITLLLQFVWEVAQSCGNRVLIRAEESYTLARHRRIHGHRQRCYSVFYLIFMLVKDDAIAVHFHRGKVKAEIYV